MGDDGLNVHAMYFTVKQIINSTALIIQTLNLVLTNKHLLLMQKEKLLEQKSIILYHDYLSLIVQ
jgi:hypothetical protein